MWHHVYFGHYWFSLWLAANQGGTVYRTNVGLSKKAPRSRYEMIYCVKNKVHFKMMCTSEWVFSLPISFSLSAWLLISKDSFHRRFFHCNYIPHRTKLLGGGVYLFHSVRLSVRPTSRVRSVAPIQFLLDPFHIYTTYRATSEGVFHVKFVAKFQNLNF